jgi:hypothetical protein
MYAIYPKSNFYKVKFFLTRARILEIIFISIQLQMLLYSDKYILIKTFVISIMETLLRDYADSFANI